jgi:hypothetical protein
MKTVLCCFAFILPFLAYGQPATPYTRIEENGKFGCLDARKNLVIPCEYDDLLLFEWGEGTIPVRKGDRWGLIDPFNQIILPLEYQKIEKDLCCYFLTDTLGRAGVARKDGTLFVPCKYERGCWELSIRAAKMYRNDTVFVFNQEGNRLFESSYNDIRGTLFRMDLLAAQKEGRWGLMDLSEKVLLPFEYQDIQFSRNRLEVDGKKIPFLKVKKQDAWGMLDFQGKVLLPFAWQSAETTKDGRYFIVQLEGKFGLLNRDFEILIPLRFEEIVDGEEGRFWVRNGEDQTGIWSAEGEIVPARYSKENFQIEGKVVRVRDGEHNLLFSLDRDFEPFAYTHWEPFSPMNHYQAVSYHLPDGRKCLVTWDRTSPPAEIFEEATAIKQHHALLVMLKNTEKDGRTRYGIREAEFGRCVVPIVYAELDFNVTLAHIERFFQQKPGSHEGVVALGRLEKGGKWFIIGSEGTVVE